MSASDPRRHRWHLYPPDRTATIERDPWERLCGGGRARQAQEFHRRLGFALRCRIGNLARALDRCQRTAVEVVEIAAYLQLARVVDKGSLIGPVDPDRPRPQRNLLLGAAGVKTLDLLRRPLLLRVHHAGKDFGVFGSILHAHAAVT